MGTDSTAPTCPLPNASPSEPYVVDLRDTGKGHIAAVGGKGAHLGELSRIDGLHTPAGFCVTTTAFQRAMAHSPFFHDQLDQLARLEPGDRAATRALSARLRHTIEDTALPREVGAAIIRAWAASGERTPRAVRSSATAEDLPTASFAGQQDTYLNIVGLPAVLHHINRCWASLFTERAVTYRQRHAIDHRTVRMAVIVQQMVSAQAAGVLFTADPTTGNRHVSTVDAGIGLGESLVSGRTEPDTFTIRDGRVIDKTIAAKHHALRPSRDGGTHEVPVDVRRRDQPALTDTQALQLARLGRRIETHFGRPQDIEWCLADDRFHIVQSRPITTLFPVPDTHHRGHRVYVSVGHQQMMTDAMKPLGLSVWQHTAMAPMHGAGGRPFIDVTPHLAAPEQRAAFLDALGDEDPLMRDALESVVDDAGSPSGRGDPDTPPPSPSRAGPDAEADPAVIAELIHRSQSSIAALKRDIRHRTGPGLFEFLLAAFDEHKRVLSDPLSLQTITAGMAAARWLNDSLQKWLGEDNAADTLSLSVPGNITSEMGLALLDVADTIRPHPHLTAFLEHAADDTFLDRLPALPHGDAAYRAITAYLDRYGMRCAGEIDITRPRWHEQPAALLPALLDSVRNAEPGAAKQRYERGRRKAQHAKHDLLRRLRALPDGQRKAAQTTGMIDLLRTFSGYREYPKYDIVSRYAVYRQALLTEAERLTRNGVLTEQEDISYLTFPELHHAARTGTVDEHLIQQRKQAFQSYRALRPPRVITSEGETRTGTHRRTGLPPGALPGLPVSPGVTRGRARVLHSMEHSGLEPGDILVTTHTDPSWTPLFPHVSGLVTEIGGRMTHGAVVAREYGLPAVVGVTGATERIRDGQHITLNATQGYVQLHTTRFQQDQPSGPRP